MIEDLLRVIGVYKVYEKWLRETIKRGEKPQHIGVIMDGNRRWAREREMFPWQGHWEGADKTEEFLDWCLDLGIKTITLYSFSTENFNRDKKEVQELFRLFETMLERVLRSKRIHNNRVHIKVLGRVEYLPERIQELVRKDITEKTIEENLYTAHLPHPEPDIIIRTSGESRLSNFLLWQSAYSELFIVDVYWPSFRRIDLMRAIRGYQKRHRRYGR